MSRDATGEPFATGEAKGSRQHPGFPNFWAPCPLGVIAIESSSFLQEEDWARDGRVEAAYTWLQSEMAESVRRTIG